MRWFPNSGCKKITLMIYLDNAATSWPKAPGVAEAITQFLTDIGANPGRSGHRLSIEAARLVSTVREQTADLFGAPDPLRVIFTLNVTHAINLVLYGLLRPGDHVVTSSVEHNSIIRPLTALRQAGISFTAVACASDGTLDPSALKAAIKPETVMIALTHASNVLGTLLPAQRIGELARERGLLFLLDSASTAGCVPIDLQTDNIDILAFTGHKALLGPTGTGGLVIGRALFWPHQACFPGRHGQPLRHGIAAAFLPDLLECGTLNTTGLAGLGCSTCVDHHNGH